MYMAIFRLLSEDNPVESIERKHSVLANHADATIKIQKRKEEAEEEEAEAIGGRPRSTRRTRDSRKRFSSSEGAICARSRQRGEKKAAN